MVLMTCKADCPGHWKHDEPDHESVVVDISNTALRELKRWHLSMSGLWLMRASVPLTKCALCVSVEHHSGRRIIERQVSTMSTLWCKASWFNTNHSWQSKWIKPTQELKQEFGVILHLALACNHFSAWSETDHFCDGHHFSIMDFQSLFHGGTTRVTVGQIFHFFDPINFLWPIVKKRRRLNFFNGFRER